MTKLLFVGDDAAFRCKIVDALLRTDREVEVSLGTPEWEASDVCSEYDLVLIILEKEPSDQLHFLQRLRATTGAPQAIVAGGGDADQAEAAIRAGAWDYVDCSLPVEQVLHRIHGALLYRSGARTGKASKTLRCKEIVGSGESIQRCLESVALAAASDGAVLITGETGTGKELFARAVHDNSSRAGGPFVTVDCAALPPTLVESLLFGHERGAFTGAEQSREGMIKQAHGGTLFLDEIGELPYGVQKALLRVLQDKRYRRVGSGHEVSSDFRLLAATNRNLDRMVEAGKFREDLLFRLRAFHIHLPPLRERKEDVRELARHHARRLCVAYGIEEKVFSSDFFETLEACDWPGNVRELVNAMEFALAVGCPDSILFAVHLPLNVRVPAVRSAVAQPEPPEYLPQDGPSNGLGPYREVRREAVETFERAYLARLMRRAAGQLDVALNLSDLSQSRLYGLLKKYGLPRPGHGAALPEGWRDLRRSARKALLW